MLRTHGIIACMLVVVAVEAFSSSMEGNQMRRFLIKCSSLPDNVKVTHSYSHLPHLYAVEAEKGVLEQSMRVEQILPDESVQLEASKEYGWNLENLGEADFPIEVSNGLALEDVDIDGPELHDYMERINWGSYTPVIALLDSGIDYAHPQLDANIWLDPVNGARGRNFSQPEPQLEVSYSNPSANGHATFIAGIIGAIHDGLEPVGVVPQNAVILPLVAWDENGKGYISNILAALDWAINYIDQGNVIDVMNHSWSCQCEDEIYELVQGLFDALTERGVVHVVAAGNMGLRDRAEDGLLDGKRIVPATFEDVLTVANLEPDGTLASGSKYGPQTVGIAAPGTDIISTSPGGGVALGTGTSFATPHVTGVAAICRMINPDLTAREVISIIRSSAEQNENLKGQVNSALMLDADNAAMSAQFSRFTN